MFVGSCALDKWNVEKNRFERANEAVKARFFVTCIIIRAYHDVIK